jgi:outer membrane protein OmpA-like peptidoglycan-associated protein
MKALLFLPFLAVLGSCSSPPKPPLADPAKRHPVNTAESVALQICRSDLQASRIEASELSRNGDAARSVVATLTSERQAAFANSNRDGDKRSTVYTVLFPFAGTTITLSQTEAEQLAREARDAPLIRLSARTDGEVDNRAEMQIAKQRAEAVKNYLVAAGVAPGRIRSTWQATGDHAAENATAAGRALNRRVEIEIYRVAPLEAPLSAAALS